MGTCLAIFALARFAGIVTRRVHCPCAAHPLVRPSAGAPINARPMQHGGPRETFSAGGGDDALFNNFILPPAQQRF